MIANAQFAIWCPHCDDVMVITVLPGKMDEKTRCLKCRNLIEHRALVEELLNYKRLK